MKAWLKQHWRSIVIGPLLVGGVTGAGFLLWLLLATPFQGTEANARVTVGGLALIGVLTTATISLIGLLLKQSIDRRTLEISKGEQRRLQMEAAVQSVKLITLDSGEFAPKVQASAALLVLGKLGEVSLAVDLAAELWPAKQVTSTAVVRVIDYALANDVPIEDDDKPALQRSAALLLLNNYMQLNPAEHQYEWPNSLDRWPKPLELDAEARYTVALTLAEWIDQRRPSHSKDFRVKLLQQALEQDMDQKVNEIATQQQAPPNQLAD